MRDCRLSSACAVLAGALAMVLGLVLGLPGASAQLESAPYRPELPAGLDLYFPVPETNPLTPEKVTLGRRLFFDPILSRDWSVSCAACHDPLLAFTDGRTISRGVSGTEGMRNAPTLVNRAYGESQFFDGRASTLEEQAILPIQAPTELDLGLEEAVRRLRDSPDYEALFRATFGRAPTAEDLGRALASYVRTIFAGDSPVDRYINGDGAALSELEVQGLRVFREKGRCTACHIGPNFTDELFHNTGVAWSDGELRDQGRFAVTGIGTDRGAFKTPTLREIARTAPYMHDGSLTTLEEVIDFYDQGGNPNPHLASQIRPLNLTAAEKSAFVAFLEALSGRVREGVRLQ